MSLETTPTHPAADSYVTLTEANTYFSNRANTTKWDNLSDDEKEVFLKRAALQIDSNRFFWAPVVHTILYYRDKQFLKWPTKRELSASGSVDSVGSNYLIDSNLANNASYPNDIFNGGAVIITEGTGKGKTYKIDDFDFETGKVTIDGTFRPALDTTSQYRLVEEVPDKVKNAQCEQCLYLVNGGGKRAQLQSEGVKSYSLDELSETFSDAATIGGTGSINICVEAKAQLNGLISKIGKIIR